MITKQELTKLLNDPEVQRALYYAVEAEKHRQDQQEKFIKG